LPRPIDPGVPSRRRYWITTGTVLEIEGRPFQDTRIAAVVLAGPVTTHVYDPVVAVVFVGVASVVQVPPPLRLTSTRMMRLTPTLCVQRMTRDDPTVQIGRPVGEVKVTTGVTSVNDPNATLMLPAASVAFTRMRPAGLAGPGGVHAQLRAVPGRFRHSAVPV
jgi:hypothetical protein